MDTDALVDKIEKIKMPVRIAILAGTVVLLAGLFLYLVYLPKSEEISKTESSIQNLNQKMTPNLANEIEG